MKRLVKRLWQFALAALLAAGTVGCTTITPVYGAGIASDGRIELTGESSATFLFGLLPLGDGDWSVATAAANGGIKRVATVDTKTFNVLGIIVTHTTIVTGDDGAAVQSGGAPSAPRANVMLELAAIDSFQQYTDDISIVNLTHEKKLSIKVSTRTSEEENWTKYGEVRFSNINSSMDLNGSTRKFKSAKQVLLTSSSETPFTVQAIVYDDDLWLYLFPANENPAIDNAVDATSVSGVFKDNVRIVNQTSDADFFVDVYARKTEADAWSQIGVVFVQGKGDGSTVRAVNDNASAWRYFAAVPQTGKQYVYSAEKNHNDLVITMQDK